MRMLAKGFALSALAGVFGIGACGAALAQASDGGGWTPEGQVEIVVHSGPGGGSDVHARVVSEMLVEEGLIDQQWPVRNVTGGASAAAMAHMAQLEGQTDTIAAMAITWLTTPLTNAEAQVGTLDLTPIALLVTEPTIMAVRADSEWNSLQEFIEAARAAPNELTQSGGSVTSADALAAEVIKAETDTQWGYLSFSGGGERIAAVLGGNADMIFGGPSDVNAQVDAGELKVIATIGPERTELFPDAPTLPESGLDIEVPQNLRGIMGPPNMPPEAIAYYEDLFRQLVETDAWKAYAQENAFTTVFLGSEEFSDYLNRQIDSLTVVLKDLDLLAQ